MIIMKMKETTKTVTMKKMTTLMKNLKTKLKMSFQNQKKLIIITKIEDGQPSSPSTKKNLKTSSRTIPLTKRTLKFPKTKVKLAVMLMKMMKTPMKKMKECGLYAWLGCPRIFLNP